MAKILVVEDDKNILTTLSIRLRAEGHKVVVAQDGMMGVRAAAQEQPDLVILDISMPAGNGFVVAERIQSIHSTAGTPMIFMTASRQPGLQEKALSLGAMAFFEKPYDGDELMAAVRLGLGQADPNQPVT